MPQLDLLKKISDTLGVLGLGELRQRVQQEVSELSEIVDRRQDPVRSRAGQGRGRAAVGRGQPRRSTGAADSAGRGRAALGRSAADRTSNSARSAKRCCASASSTWRGSRKRCRSRCRSPADFPPQGLDNVPQLLRGITAGLLMLGKGRAVELMDAIGTRGAQADRAGRAGSGRAAPRAHRRRHRQHRVLHGDAAERTHRSLVHARQRRNLPEGAGRGGALASAAISSCRTTTRPRPSSSIPRHGRAGERQARARPRPIRSPPSPRLPAARGSIRSSWNCSSRRPKKKSHRSSRSSRCGTRIPWTSNRWVPCAAASTR